MQIFSKKTLALILAIAVLGGGAFLLRSKPADDPKGPGGGPGMGGPPVMTVRVAEVKTGTWREETAAVGTLRANESIMIRPEIDGRVSAIHFNEGQTVGAGAKLVSLKSDEIEAQLKANAAEVSLAKSRLERAEDLRNKNFISAQALDEARENFNQAQARAAEIQARLDKAVIRAPFAGVTGVREISPGAYVNKGQDIARLEGLGTLKLDFRVPERYLSRIKPGQAVQVNVDAYPGEQFSGEIYAVEPAIDEQTRTLLLRARVPNPQAKLKPGLFARVTVVFGVKDNTILIPEQAVVPRGRDFFVFRVIDDKVTQTKIELGQRRPGEVEVLSGVKPGEQVVTDGQLRIKDGAKVKIQMPDDHQKPAAPGK